MEEEEKGVEANKKEEIEPEDALINEAMHEEGFSNNIEKVT